jgi:hypothetical protein
MPVAIPSVCREAAPPGHRRWAAEQKDKFSQLEERFQQWLAAIQYCEDLFQKHVYGNPNPSQLDFRQHRGTLFELIGEGEAIATDYCVLREENVEQYVALIDSKNEQLFRVLLQWHMLPNFQDEVPESFKQGMRDAADGKLMTFPSPDCAAEAI